MNVNKIWIVLVGAALPATLLGPLKCPSMVPWAAGLGTSARAETGRSPVAPELVGKDWLNTPGNKPLSLASRRGKVTVVEFWTFGCSNCQANLPAYSRWNQKFSPRDVAIIGVHTPESSYEADPRNVARRVQELGISYPILLDPKYANWNRWNQHYWPAIYIVDKRGHIRTSWDGELGSGSSSGEARIESLIEQLLREAAPTTKG